MEVTALLAVASVARGQTETALPLLTLPVSSVETSTVMASLEYETTMGETGVNPHDEWMMLFIFHFYFFLFFFNPGQNGSCVCVWRRCYVTDPRPVPWVRKGRRPHVGLSRWWQQWGWELGRIWGGGLWESPFIASFLVPFPLLLCTFLRLLLPRRFSLRCLSSLSVCAWHRGGKMPQVHYAIQ